MRLSIFLAAIFFSACASLPPNADDEAQALAEATDECLASPELAKRWGECNVKQTIFESSAAIRNCQMKHLKKAASGETLMLRIRVLPTGKVQDVKAEGAGPKNRSLEKCLSTQIAKLRFAAPPKGVNPVVYFPFEQ